MRNPSDQSGFTLLEVVLGLAISAVIFALVLGAIRLSERSQRKGMQRQEQTQRVRILYDRIGWLVRGAYPYIYTDPEDPEDVELFFTGSKDSLNFVTTSIDPFSEGPVDAPGMKYVEISVEEGLTITEQIFFMGDEGTAEDNKYVLDAHVKSLEFSYLDPGTSESTEDEAEEGEQFWTEDWDGTDKHYLPLAVKVRMLMDFGDRQQWTPPVIATLRAARTRSAGAGNTEAVAPAAVPIAPRARPRLR